MMEKIKLVVINENTLGYIRSNIPDTIVPLHISIIKGAIFRVHNDPHIIFPHDTVRSAKREDFDEFRVTYFDINTHS